MAKKVSKKAAAVEPSRASIILALPPVQPGAYVGGTMGNVKPSGWVDVERATGGADLADERDVSRWVAVTTRQLAKLPAAVEAKWKLVQSSKHTAARTVSGYFTLVLDKCGTDGAGYVAGEVRHGSLNLTATLGHFFLLAELASKFPGELAAVRYVGGVLYVSASGFEVALDGWRHAEHVGELAADVEVKLSARVVAAVDDSGAVVRVASKSAVVMVGPYDLARVAERLATVHGGYARLVTSDRGGLVFEFLNGEPLTAGNWKDLTEGIKRGVKNGDFEGCMAGVDSLEVVTVAEVEAVQVAAVVEVPTAGEVAVLAAVAEVVELEAQRAADEAARAAYRAAHFPPAVEPVAAPAALSLGPVVGELVAAYLARLICPRKAAYARGVAAELGGGAAAVVPAGLAADLAADVRRRVGSLAKKDARAAAGESVGCAAD